MRSRRRILGSATVALGFALASGGPSAPVAAEDAAADDGKAEWAEEEMDDCLDCHDETAKYPVLPILATRHAVKADERTPLAQQHECQTCHGPSAAHIDDDTVPTAIAFGPKAPAGPQNAQCLKCHQGGKRMNWQGSIHATSEVACASCHKIHVKEDPVMVVDRRPDTPIRRPGQLAVCLQCHMEKRAEIQKSSAHPLRDGLIQCSDCHDPHGSIGPTNLVKPTVNETCYTCHAEKRGPFLWEHAPVSEDCLNCHNPHGSNHPTLLKSRYPQLCEQCHIIAHHPSDDYDGPDYSNAVAGGVPVIDRRVGSRGCLNCHTEVHGSNHLAGGRWTR